MIISLLNQQILAQHRYYGESIPGIAMEERTNETLGYLTSEQALADYATLILDLKKNLSAEDCPVVVFGGSYGGSKRISFIIILKLLFSPQNQFVFV